MTEPKADFFRALAETLIKVWAASVVIYGGYLVTLNLLTHFIMTNPDQATSQYFLANTISSGLYLLMGATIWFSARWLAKITTAKTTISVRSTVNLSQVNLVSIGCFLVGVFYLLKYVPDVLVETTKWIGSLNKTSENFGYTRSDLVAANWIGVLLASFFVFGASNIVSGATRTRKFFSWLRTADMKPDEEDDQTPPSSQT